MRRIIPSSAPWKMSGISRTKVTRDAEPDFRFERRSRQGIIVLRPQGTSRSEDLGGDPMSSHRARIVLLVAVFTLLSARAAPAQEQASPHIQTALTFLTAWGNQRWDELKTVAAVQVTVKVGDKAFTLEPAAQKAEVALVFPFRGLSTVRQDEKVKGVTVEELGLKVGDSETRGPGSITLKEQDGQYWVTEVSTGAAPPGEKK